MKVVTLNSIVAVIRERRGYKGFLHKFIEECEIVDAIIIPEGATNGDMFRAVFGYEPATDSVVCNKKDWCGDSEPCNYCMSNPDNIGREEDWWNAPYEVKE